jgi:ankyrin repeat protein
MKRKCLVLILIWLLSLGFSQVASGQSNKDLLDAAWKNNIKLVKALLAKGAHVNAKDKDFHCHYLLY